MTEGDFDCAACAKRSYRLGSSLRMVFGLKSRVCQSCAKKMTKAAKLPDFVIGVDGKRVKLPNKAQKLFTSGGKVQPTKVAGYPGYDIRYGVEPAFRGEFSRMGPGRYVEE